MCSFFSDYLEVYFILFVCLLGGGRKYFFKLFFYFFIPSLFSLCPTPCNLYLLYLFLQKFGQNRRGSDGPDPSSKRFENSRLSTSLAIYIKFVRDNRVPDSNNNYTYTGSTILLYYQFCNNYEPNSSERSSN